MKTLFKNAKVWLGKNYFTESVGFDLENGNIDFIGSDTEAKKNQSDYDETIDLEKKLVIPAFTDGHCHLVKGALANHELNLRNAKTKSEIINEIKKYKQKGTDWIKGGYFTDAHFEEEIELNRNFLDEICPDVPVFIIRFDIHSGFANSKALEMTGFENKKSEFPDEEIVIDKSGALTGELKERAFYYFLDCIPEKATAEKSEIVKEQIDRMHSYGITAVSDIPSIGDLDVYEFLLNQDKMNLKIYSILPFKEFNNIEDHKKRFENFYSNIQFRCFKAYYDGSLSSETAFFWDNYKGKQHNGFRTEFVKSGEFESIGLKIDKAGYQIAVHAIGDKAVSELLDFDKFLTIQNGVKKRRFRIEHAQHVQEKDFERFYNQDIIASVQPAHLYSDAKVAIDKVKDIRTTHNYKKLIDKGVKVCFGTDFPIVNENPFETIYYAMKRKADVMDKDFLSDYKIDLVNCLEAYTFNNAYASFQDNIRGNIRVDKTADLIILDDLFAMSPDEIREARLAMTYINGKRIH